MVPKTVSNYSCQPKSPISTFFCWISSQITFTCAKDPRNPCCSLHTCQEQLQPKHLWVSQIRAPLCQEELPWPCFASSGPGVIDLGDALVMVEKNRQNSKGWWRKKSHIFEGSCGTLQPIVVAQGFFNAQPIRP